MTVALIILLLTFSIVYLTQGQGRVPNIHIDVEGIDLDAGTITGVGVSGITVTGLTAADVVEGIKGKSLRFGSGDRLAVQVSQPQCYCSSDYCNGKITLSFWIMTFSGSVQHIVTPENSQNTGVTCLLYSYIMQCHYKSPGIKLLVIESTSTLVRSEWTCVALVVDLNVGGSIFLNGVLDGFKDISEAESHPDTHYPSCSTVYFGGKYSATEYPMDANADEFKYFYDVLSPTGNCDI